MKRTNDAIVEIRRLLVAALIVDVSQCSRKPATNWFEAWPVGRPFRRTKISGRRPSLRAQATKTAISRRYAALVWGEAKLPSQVSTASSIRMTKVSRTKVLTSTYS